MLGTSAVAPPCKRSYVLRQKRVVVRKSLCGTCECQRVALSADSLIALEAAVENYVLFAFAPEGTGNVRS